MAKIGPASNTPGILVNPTAPGAKPIHLPGNTPRLQSVIQDLTANRLTAQARKKGDILHSPDGQGISWVESGQLCTTVVRLTRDGVESFSVTPFGQSNDPDSPHHVDQGLELFGKGRLKPTWYDRDRLLQHVESRKTLTLPRK